MSKLIPALFMVSALTGCAEYRETQRRDAEQKAAQKAEQDAQQAAQFKAQVDAYVVNQCAYAKSDQIKYGDCARQVRQFLVQLEMQQWNDFQAKLQAQSQANANAQMLQALKPPPAPSHTSCTTQWVSGVAYTNCN